MTNSIEDISNQAFDFVVVGAGTAGLVIASRLVADPSITVAVLEAGPDLQGDPAIDIPAPPGITMNSSKYAWIFKSTPQAHLGHREVPMPRGKTLGGSSAVNFLAWCKPPAGDVDDWEKLGNVGWNWERFQRYAKKVESFTPAGPERQELHKRSNLSSHGINGPLKTKFPEWIFKGDSKIRDTLHAAGIPNAEDPYGGNPIGTCTLAATVDPVTHTRSYSASSYYHPNMDKENLTVLCNSVVEMIQFSPTVSGEDIKATGVYFHYDNVKYVVHVRKEVILCAGALKTPQILEQSGIGSGDVLTPLGIPVNVELPGVGANLQEHVYCGVVFELDSTYETLDKLSDPVFATEQLTLHREQKGMLTMTCTNYTFAPLKLITTHAPELIAEQRGHIEEKIRSGSLPPGLTEQWLLQLERLEEARSGECEMIAFPAMLFGGAPEPGKSYLTIAGANNSLFSRGSVHITSKDPHVDPDIDPHYFEEDFDLKVLAEVLKFTRRLAELEPLKSMIAKEVFPGPAVSEEDELVNFIKKYLDSVYHTTSTASMLPRNKNGVVDGKLRVYGTTNLRIADLSIIPLHIAAHTQSSAYAIGEIAADIVRDAM
ncbi:GMC oxidoreductase [Rickenella mellea]|uniref:GMC oxidoreductase n=1 Tax=Rickenella mellea TaxID=50990 RepID=A0A4Y7Q3X2_9AGAM|nr:GMC oxidoreductase [Rickenella mellea]